MKESQDYIRNVNSQGVIIQNLFQYIEQIEDIETGFRGEEVKNDLTQLWNSIKENANMILSKVDVPIPGVGVPTAFEEVVESCNRETEWKSYASIGSGRVGDTYTACKVNDCNYVIKRQPVARVEANLRETSDYVEVDSFKSEVNALIALQEWKHAPKIYAAWTCNGYGYIVMEKLYTCDLTNRYADVVNMVDELFMRGWVHTDAHQTNILCRGDGELVLIDYGRARSFQDENDVGFMSPHAWDTMTDERHTPTRVREIELNNIAVRDYGMVAVEDAVQIIRTDQYEV